MSAFFVPAATIDTVVAAFIAAEGPLSLEAATTLGRDLWALNAEAVRWRYNLDTGTPGGRPGGSTRQRLPPRPPSAPS